MSLLKFKVLGGRIRDERKSQGLSQTELANLSDVSLNFLSQLEGGKTTVRIDKTLKVMQTLGLEFKIQYGSSGISE